MDMVIPAWRVTFNVPSMAKDASQASGWLRVPHDQVESFIEALRFGGADHIEMQRESFGSGETTG